MFHLTDLLSKLKLGKSKPFFQDSGDVKHHAKIKVHVCFFCASYPRLSRAYLKIIIFKSSSM